MKRRRTNYIYIPVPVRIILILAVCTIFVGIVIYTNNRDKQETERWKQVVEESKAEKESLEAAEEAYRLEQEEKYSFALLGDAVTSEDDFLISVYDVLAGEAEGEIVVAPETFATEATSTSGYDGDYASVSLEVSCSLGETYIAVLQFRAQTESGSGWLDVSYGEDEVSVWVSETAATFYVPIAGEYDISEICFKMDTADFVRTYIDEVYLVNYEDTAITALRIGTYSDYECEASVIATENYELDVDTEQCLIKDGYLYALHDGTLGVYQITDTGYDVVSEYTGLGDTRDMAFTDDKGAMLVSAGLNGMYILDVSDPNNITYVSHYATLGESSDVFVSESYAFVCNGNFGIEMVDISDISNPVYVNQLSFSQITSNVLIKYAECFVADGYLYISASENGNVLIYDISDLNSPSLCTIISLNGSTGGLYVSDGILYASTGGDSDNASNSSGELGDFGTGTGSGLEIYDVSNPSVPVHLSTVKTLGRLSYDENDVWDVVVSGDYAYLSSWYNGLYVFDVSDPEKPVCVDIYEIEAESGSELYESVDATTYAFPYDTESVARGSINHVCLQDGYLYALTSNMGIYKITADYIAGATETGDFEYTVSEADVSVPSVDGCTVELYESVSSIYAVAAYDGYYYVACGDGGIDVLDGNLTAVANYPTDYAVLDIKAAGGYLFTAENEGGVGIWLVSGATVERVSTYCPTDNGCYSSIVTTDDGNFLIAQSSSDSYVLVNATDKYNPVSAGDADAEIGSMGYRSLCSGVAGNYLCAYGSNLMCWYYYDGVSLSHFSSVENTIYSERGGMCPVLQQSICIRNGGYYFYDPTTDTTSPMLKLDEDMLNGKCFYNGELLVVVDECTGRVSVVDMSDVPRSVTQFKVDGNPDIGIFDGDYLLIPCRNLGLLRIDISALEIEQ